MNKLIQIGNMRTDSENFKNPQTGRVYFIRGLAPTLNTCQGGDRQPKIIVKVDKKMKMICERRMDEGLRTFKNDVVGTIRTIDSGGRQKSD